MLREFVDTDSPRNRSFSDSTPPRAVPIAIVLDLIGFPGLIRDADLVITGEGSVDEQTLRGKGAGRGARRGAGCEGAGGRGRCLLDEEQLRAAGFADLYTLAAREPDRARSMANAAPLLRSVGADPAARLDWGRGTRPA